MLTTLGLSFWIFRFTATSLGLGGGLKASTVTYTMMDTVPTKGTRDIHSWPVRNKRQNHSCASSSKVWSVTTHSSVHCFVFYCSTLATKPLNIILKLTSPPVPKQRFQFLIIFHNNNNGHLACLTSKCIPIVIHKSLTGCFSHFNFDICPSSSFCSSFLARTCILPQCQCQCQQEDQSCTDNSSFIDCNCKCSQTQLF